MEVGDRIHTERSVSHPVHPDHWLDQSCITVTHLNNFGDSRRKLCARLFTRGPCLAQSLSVETVGVVEATLLIVVTLSDELVLLLPLVSRVDKRFDVDDGKRFP